MTATQPKNRQATEGKVYRAKVTGRHAITIPMAVCQALDIQVGDYIEFEVEGDEVTMRPLPPVPISSLRGILSQYFPDSASIRAFLEEERSGWDEREEFLDQIWEKKWPKADSSDG